MTNAKQPKFKKAFRISPKGFLLYTKLLVSFVVHDKLAHTVFDLDIFITQPNVFHFPVTSLPMVGIKFRSFEIILPTHSESLSGFVVGIHTNVVDMLFNWETYSCKLACPGWGLAEEVSGSEKFPGASSEETS